MWKRDVREHVGKVWKKERNVRKQVGKEPPAIEPDHYTFVTEENFFGKEYSRLTFLNRNIFYLLSIHSGR